MSAVAQHALLVLDVQPAVLARYPDPAYLPRLRRAIGAARTSGVPVIHAIVGFRPGYPEVSTRNKMFGRLVGTTAPPGSDQAMQPHPEVAPEPGDVVVIKKRVSAFAGSDLDIVLRSMDVDHLVIAGVATSGVVLSTVRQAADLDFGVTVLSDGCLDNDPEVHRVLTQKVFPTQSDVMTISGWEASLTA